MEKRRWKENPKYSEDDLLYRIAEAVGDIPAPLDADYGECAVVGGVPARRAEMPFKITDLSLSPSRIVLPDQEIFEEEKERLKKNVKAALSKFRSSRLEYLKRLYSPDTEVQKALDAMDISGALPEVLDEAKKRLKEQGFSDQQIESVCFTPTEKAMKFATDDLAAFLKPLMSDFDVLFGKLSSFDPAERKKALATVIRAWEEAAEEWEAEEKENVRNLSPGLLLRLSRSDVSFAQQMKNISESSFRSLSDFDTMLGSFVVSGMFPPVALLYLLPIIVPGLLDLIFSEVSESRQKRAEDYKELISSEMARLYAGKATGNALMAEMALRLAGGESPERLWNDMPKMKEKLRDMFDSLYESGKKLFGEHSHNDPVQPGSAEHIKIVEEARETAKAAANIFWDERKAKAVATVEESALAEARIADSVRLNFGDRISFVFDSVPGEDAFSRVKLEQAEKYIKEYVEHLNKIYKNDDPNTALFLRNYGIIPYPVRIAMMFSSDYGVFGDRAGSQSGTSIIETKMILNTLKELNLEDEMLSLSDRARVVAGDAVARMLPQELLGYVNGRMGEVNIKQAAYYDEMEKLLDISAPVEKSFEQIKKELRNLSEQTKKTAGLLLFLSDIREEGSVNIIPELFGVKNFAEAKPAMLRFFKEFKNMDDSQLNAIASELYTVFNRTVTEPGILETVRNHEVPFDTEEKDEVIFER